MLMLTCAFAFVICGYVDDTDEQTGFALAKKIGKAVAGIHNAG